MSALTSEERELAERVARRVVERRLTVPAVLALESMKPLAFLGGQAMHFFEPMVRTLLAGEEFRVARQILEDRDKLEALLRRIEAIEALRDGVARA